MFHLGIDVLVAKDHTVGIVNGSFADVDEGWFLVQGKVFGLNVLTLEFLIQLGLELTGDALVINGLNDLGNGEHGGRRQGYLEVKGHQTGEPAIAMNDIGGPAEFFHCFNHSAGKENGALVVVGRILSSFICKGILALEEILIINKIDLHASGLDRSHFNYQRMVGIVDYQVHTRKADNFVQLIAALVDATETRHERSNFLTFFLDTLGKVPADEAHMAFLQVGGDFLLNEKYSGFFHKRKGLTVRTKKWYAKVRNFLVIFKFKF